ncbi:hypothetical protein [Natronobiforma cellulositropha]|uniref:hypothetical protein n=1 Tax=Natronobiforma cellulositropha TaxID=1679076 RepID=UPI0021D57D75|nr:hypothetical protein [Natronobiforma cellulositropha]
MSDDPLERAERTLDRATGLETERALAVLAEARTMLRANRDDPALETERLDALETRLTQRIREVREREAYDSNLGASMNPEDEDAP